MNKVLTLEQMQDMSIDDMISMYRNGYKIEENVNNLNPEIVSAQGANPEIVSAQGVTVSTGALLLIGLGILAYMFIKR